MLRWASKSVCGKTKTVDQITVGSDRTKWPKQPMRSQHEYMNSASTLDTLNMCMHIHNTILYNFPFLPTGIICSTSKSLSSWRSFHLFSLPPGFDSGVIMEGEIRC